MERKLILTGDNPALLWAVIDESVLWRLVGSPQIMQEQLAALAEAARMNNVTIQVVPANTGGTSGLSGAFVIATIGGESGAIYLDDAAEGRVTSNPQEITEIVNRYDGIRSEALPAQASIDLITKVMKERWTRT